MSPPISTTRGCRVQRHVQQFGPQKKKEPLLDLGSVRIFQSFCSRLGDCRIALCLTLLTSATRASPSRKAACGEMVNRPQWNRIITYCATFASLAVKLRKSRVMRSVSLNCPLCCVFAVCPDPKQGPHFDALDVHGDDYTTMVKGRQRAVWSIMR